MILDISQLTAAPWIPSSAEGCPIVTEEPGHNGIVVMFCSGQLSRWNHVNQEAIALLRNDLDVRQRLHWHTEYCEKTKRWFVPQLRKFTMAMEATYQDGHDVGLLTKAEKWYRETVNIDIDND